DELRYTRERMAESTACVNYIIGIVRMSCGKLSERKSRQDRVNTRTLENPQGMRHPNFFSVLKVCATRLQNTRVDGALQGRKRRQAAALQKRRLRSCSKNHEWLRDRH